MRGRRQQRGREGRERGRSRKEKLTEGRTDGREATGSAGEGKVRRRSDAGGGEMGRSRGQLSPNREKSDIRSRDESQSPPARVRLRQLALARGSFLLMGKNHVVDLSRSASLHQLASTRASPRQPGPGRRPLSPNREKSAMGSPREHQPAPALS